MGCGFWRVEGPSHSWFCTSSRHFRGAIFLFLLASWQLKRKKKDTIYSTKTFTKKYAVLKESRASAREVGVGNSTSSEKWHGAQKATIWSTKSCTLKDPSGAWSGPQKVARKKTHLEHDLEHKKLHAKRPIWSTIWSTKSCKKHGKKPYPIMQNEFMFCAIFGMLQKKWATCTISSSICQLSIV